MLFSLTVLLELPSRLSLESLVVLVGTTEGARLSSVSLSSLEQQKQQGEQDERISKAGKGCQSIKTGWVSYCFGCSCLLRKRGSLFKMSLRTMKDVSGTDAKTVIYFESPVAVSMSSPTPCLLTFQRSNQKQDVCDRTLKIL